MYESLPPTDSATGVSYSLLISLNKSESLSKSSLFWRIGELSANSVAMFASAQPAHPGSNPKWSELKLCVYFRGSFGVWATI
jgi:hypothetical protein